MHEVRNQLCKTKWSHIRKKKGVRNQLRKTVVWRVVMKKKQHLGKRNLAKMWRNNKLYKEP